MNIAQLLNQLPGAVAQGLIWGIMAIGVYITFRILDIADLTVDGSFATGGAVLVSMVTAGQNLYLAMFCAFLAGCAAGLLATNVILLFIMIIICSIAVVILGLYTGYLQGSRFRSLMYLIGAILLWLAAIGILVRLIAMYI